MKKQSQEQIEAIAKLRKWLKPGDTVYTVLRNVSRSGMQREIGVVVLRDGQDLHPNYLIAKALGERQGKRDGLIMSGCGTDMGFEIVYNLGRKLFPDGFAVTERCNKCQDRPGLNGIGHSCKACKGTGYKPARGRNGDTSGWDSDGGYALKQRWL